MYHLIPKSETGKYLTIFFLITSTDFSFSERTPLHDPSWARYALTAYVDSKGILNAVGGSDANGKFAQNIIRYNLSTIPNLFLTNIRKSNLSSIH
jgi:hypothetical protein